MRSFGTRAVGPSGLPGVDIGTKSGFGQAQSVFFSAELSSLPPFPLINFPQHESHLEVFAKHTTVWSLLSKPCLST